MVWNNEFSQGYESRKCRYRVAKYLKGYGFDLGCGNEKICPQAIGIDICGAAAEIKLDLSNPETLNIFSTESVDYVFSSHLLEDMFDTKNVLKAWWRLIRIGGYLILYLPHKDLYPNVGEPGANPNHKHDFFPDDIISIIREFGVFDVIECKRYDQKDEYSFEIILQKKHPVLKEYDKPKEKTISKKKALVIRYGAMGDNIIVTPVLRLLKELGYHVTVNTVPETKFVFNNNPNVDDFLMQEKGVIPDLEDYHKYLMTKYDRFVNLCYSIERTMLRDSGTKEFYGEPITDDRNYYDRTLELAGFTEKGLNGEIYFSEQEKVMLDYFRKKNSKTFNILWCPKGSGIHKICTHSDDIIDYLLDTYPDVKIFMVGGGDVDTIDAWKRDRLENRINIWTQRTSMIMTSVMDLVVAPETGVLNAAGCFDTPKIGLLTHSSHNNLTKYFKNCIPIQSKAKCSPCHKLLHDYFQVCPKDDQFGVPICAASFDKQEIIDAVRSVYDSRIKR